MKPIMAIESETLVVNDENDTEFIEMIELQCGSCFGIFSIQQLFVKDTDNEITCPYCKNEMRISNIDNEEILKPKYEFQE